MTISLYELAGADPDLRFSPHCWKSRLALSHKGLDYQTIPVRFTEKNKIAFSNQALLPVIQDVGETVCDSWNIAEYLEQQYPDHPSLFGDQRGKVLAESINHWCDSVLALHIRPIIILSIHRVLGDKDRAYFRQTIEQKLGATLEEVAEQSATMKESLHQALGSVRDLLAIRDYLGGSSPTYADISLMGTLLWADSVLKQPLIDPSDPVSMWCQRMHSTYSDAIMHLSATELV